MAPHVRTSAPLVTPSRVLVGILLAAPFVAMMWASSYARVEPRLGGFPFFYWYQILWIFLSAACTSGAYFLVRREKRKYATTAPTRHTERGSR